MSIERQNRCPEPRWESEWREHEENRMDREKTDMPPITPEQQIKIHTAYEALPAIVQEYVDITEQLRSVKLLPADVKRYREEQQTRLIQIIRDENLAKSLGNYTNAVSSIRMKS